MNHPQYPSIPTGREVAPGPYVPQQHLAYEDDVAVARTPITPNSQRNNEGQAVRRRISRACDQCNSLRTKCNGAAPCGHCVEFGLTCGYERARKKRGKVSRKDMAAQQAAGPGPDVDKESSERSGNEDGIEQHPAAGKTRKRKRSGSNLTQNPTTPASHHLANPLPPSLQHASDSNGLGTVSPENQTVIDHQVAGINLPRQGLPSIDSSDRNMAMAEFSSIDDYHRSMLRPGAGVSGYPTSVSNGVLQGGSITGYGEGAYGISPVNNQHVRTGNGYQTEGSSDSGGLAGQSPAAASPGWMTHPSAGPMYPGMRQMPPSQPLRYPVLQPLAHHVLAIMPVGLACDLLELYFSSTSSIFMQPQSPYILGYIFRKRSFLRPHSPRRCSPALLASMLWVAAQTSESAFLSSSPSARGKICQKLLELTVSLLNPLIHTSADESPGQGGNTIINGVALGGLGVALPSQAHESDDGSPGASGGLDDVATYIHLATVVSASEYKAASLRWWNAAWSLARELKLGRELAPDPDIGNGTSLAGQPADEMDSSRSVGIGGVGQNLNNTSNSVFVSEEEREERRRIWWLLYSMDRHLALCYNRPLFLLDIECEGLYQPENDVSWHAGEYYHREDGTGQNLYRKQGPWAECTGHSMFGYFLPLMTILGEIVDLNQARNHPRFGLRSRNGSDWDSQTLEISEQLEAYGRSLRAFEARNIEPTTTPTAQQGVPNPVHAEAVPLDATRPMSYSNPPSQRMSEYALQTKIVIAYGTHLMHTLHVLLNGKWDPISLLDDNDLWISSQSFISATDHAVSAAEALNEILDYDPDLSFMPFFFGIYLLQGSFLLLLIADKLQGEASPKVIKACETIVRAHEACVVTLNTEYQRNFRKVMRSALAQVRGRMVEDFGEQQRRREVLALYRWTGDGTGLAL